MPAPAIQNTFTGANLGFPNHGIHTLLAQVIQFRKQLTVRPEFRQQSGWNNELNAFMMAGLNELDITIRRIVYNPSGPAPENTLQREKEAADTSRDIRKEFDSRSLNADDLVLPAAASRPVVHTLDGTDKDIPQPTSDLFPNEHARVFVAGLDDFFVQATRLDSRHDTLQITKYEGAMLHSLLNALFTICEVHGGEVNRSRIPSGTLPSQDAATFKTNTPVPTVQ